MTAMLLGCAFHPTVQPEKLQCTDDRGCPKGYRCERAGDSEYGICCSSADAAACPSTKHGDAADARASFAPPSSSDLPNDPTSTVPGEDATQSIGSLLDGTDAPLPHDDVGADIPGNARADLAASPSNDTSLPGTDVSSDGSNDQASAQGCGDAGACKSPDRCNVHTGSTCGRPGWYHVAVGGYSAATAVCATTSDGRLLCWGSNGFGLAAVNDPGRAYQTTPTLASPQPDAPVAEVILGWLHAAARLIDGRLLGWGWSYHGESGISCIENETTGARGSSTYAPTLLATSFVATRLNTGTHHACAVDAQGFGWCWGRNTDAQLGLGTPDDVCHPVPSKIATITGIDSLTGGFGHTCVVKSQAVYCWGFNASGQLGDGTTTARTTPVAVKTSGKIIAISSRYLSTYAISSQGRLEGWGENNHGQLSRPPASLTFSSVPVEVALPVGNSTVESVAVGGFYACAATSSPARVYCWGDNSFGQLGNGAKGGVCVTGGLCSPTNVKLPSDVTAIRSLAAGESTTCAVVNGGRLFCWGDNKDGQLGNGTQTPSYDPIEVILPD